MSEFGFKLNDHVTALAQRLIHGEFPKPAYQPVNAHLLTDGNTPINIMNLSEAAPWAPEHVGEIGGAFKAPIILHPEVASYFGPFLPLGGPGIQLAHDIGAYAHVDKAGMPVLLLQRPDGSHLLNDKRIGNNEIGRLLEDTGHPLDKIEKSLYHGYFPALLEMASGVPIIKQLIDKALGRDKKFGLPVIEPLPEERVLGGLELIFQTYAKYLVRVKYSQIMVIPISKLDAFIKECGRQGLESNYLFQQIYEGKPLDLPEEVLDMIVRSPI